MLAWIRREIAYGFIAIGLLVTGASSTIAFSALTSLVVSSVPEAQSGLASGVQNTPRQTGALMSVSILGSILNSASFASRLPVAFAVLAVAVLPIAVAVFAARSRSTPAP